MYGAHNKNDAPNPTIRASPELRASSIRGTLRYWLRAVLGSQAIPISHVYDLESAILGSTDQGSKVRLQIRSISTAPQARLSVLPEETHRHQLRHFGYPAGTRFSLSLETHPLYIGDVLHPDGPLFQALLLMIYFGGLGRRARRGSGNLQIVTAKGYEGDFPFTRSPEGRQELATQLVTIAHHAAPPKRHVGHRPDFPVFAEDTAVVLLGEHLHQDYTEAFDELWQVSGSYHHQRGIFGDVNPRRASAIYMRVAKTQAGYFSQQTMLYCGSGDWPVMQQYIDHCLINGFTAIYGTWRHWT